MPGRPDPRQLDLLREYVLPEPPAHQPGSLDCAAEVRAAISLALKRAPGSRAEVAARMSDLVGRAISQDMLNSWSAESAHNHRFPLEYGPALEVATGSSALRELFARKTGAIVATRDQAIDAKIGGIAAEIETLDKRKRDLKAVQTALRRMQGGRR